jgi:hypothetical protein
MQPDKRTIQADRVYTLGEVALILQISPVTARRWAAARKLPTVKIGREHRLMGQALIDMLTPGQPKDDGAGDRDSEP